MDKEEKEEVAVDLAGCCFRLQLGKTTAGKLGLLLSGVSTPEESQRLARLLRQLRASTPSRVFAEEGEVENPTEAKRLWLEALRSAELSAAESLRQRLAKPGGVDRYLGR